MLGGELHPMGGAHVFFTRADVQFLALNSHSASYCEPVSEWTSVWLNERGNLWTNPGVDAAGLALTFLTLPNRAKLPISTCARCCSATAQLPWCRTRADWGHWVSLNTEGFALQLVWGKTGVLNCCMVRLKWSRRSWERKREMRFNKYNSLNFRLSYLAVICWKQEKVSGNSTNL